MEDIGQQIQIQRNQIVQTKSQLQEAKKSNLIRSEQELRGIDRRNRQPKPALVQRAERKAKEDLLTQSEKGVGAFEVEFEKEVASKAPQYGKTEYVDVEYEQAKDNIQSKIDNLKSQIYNKEQQYSVSREIGDSEQANKIDDDLGILRARISGYQKALSGDKTTVIQNVNSGYADQLANYEAGRRESNVQFKQDLKEGKFNEQVNILGLDKSNLSMSDFNRAIKNFNNNIKYEEMKSKIDLSYIEPEIVKGTTSPALVDSSQGGVYENIFTGNRMSAMSKPKGYIQVNEALDKLLPQKSNSKGLNTIKPINSNGFSNIASGYSINDIPLGSSQQPNSGDSSWLGRFTSRFKDNLQKGKESYSPELGAYVSASPAGQSGTAYIRPATPEEVSKMNEINNPIEKYIFQTDKKSDNILTISSKELQDRKNRVEYAREVINSNQKNVDEKTNLWLGSQEELDAYNRAVSDSQDKIRVGLFGGEKVYLQDIETKGFGGVATVLGETVGRTIRPAFKSVAGYFAVRSKYGGNRVLSDEDFIFKQEEIRTINRPIIGTIQRDNLGNVIYSKNETIIIPQSKELRKDKYSYLSTGFNLAGEAGYIAGRVSPYLIPVAGTVLFAGEVGENLAKSNFNVITYAKENPYEATALASVGLLKGISFGNKLFKYSKYEKYVSSKNINQKVTIRNRRVIENSLAPEKRIKPKASISQANSKLTIEVVPKVKGKIKQTEVYLSDDFAGKVVEERNVGLFKKKKFKGTESFIGGEYTEVLNIGKNLKRVTKINKEGKGTIELIKDRKVILNRKIKPESSIDFFGAPKSKQEKLTFDIQDNNPVVITEARMNQALVERQIIDAEGNKVITMNKPDLSSKRTVGEIRANIESAKNIETGKFKVQQDITGFSDVITSSERKGIVELGKDGKNIIIRKRVGQTIEFGQDIERDLGKAIINQNEKRVARVISPNVNRETIEGAKQTIIVGYINPRGKSIKQLRKAQSKQYDKIKKVISNDLADQRVFMKLKNVRLKKEPKITIINNVKEAPTPSYVGGSGGSNSASIYESGSLGFEMSKSVYVPETETILKGSKTSKNLPDISITPVLEDSKKSIPFIKSRTLAKTQNGIKIETDETTAKKSSKISESLLNKENIKNDLKDLNRNKQKPKDIIKSFERQFQKPLQKEEIRLDVKTQLKLEQRPRQQSMERSELKETVKNPSKIKSPKIKIPIPIGLGKAVKQVAKKIAEEPEELSIFVRKAGKDIEVKSGIRSKEQAKNILLGKLSNELRASGFVQTKSGRKIKVNELGNVGLNFRASKKDEFRIVEVKEARLKRRGRSQEVSEIISFKKGKKASNIFGL